MAISYKYVYTIQSRVSWQLCSSAGSAQGLGTGLDPSVPIGERKYVVSTMEEYSIYGNDTL